MICGFVVLWIDLFFWGFTAGPANALPYVDVVASLILFVVLSAAALFVPRIACYGALVVSVAMLAPTIWFLPQEKDLAALATVGIPPMLSLCAAGIYLWRTRGKSATKTASWLALGIRLCLAVVPVGIFVSYFNAPLVLSLMGLEIPYLTRPVHFLIPDGFRGEIRIEHDVAIGFDPPFEHGNYTIRIPSSGLVKLKTFDFGGRIERAFLSNGQQVRILGQSEEPEVTALRDLGTFEDAANDLPSGTEVYVYGTSHDAENLLARYRQNFEKVRPTP
jgi:hypothetical protein